VLSQSAANGPGAKIHEAICTRASSSVVRLYAFDTLATRKRDLRDLPLLERKRHLRDSFEDTDTLVFASAFAEAGERVFEQVRAYGQGTMGEALKLELPRRPLARLAENQGPQLPEESWTGHWGEVDAPQLVANKSA
jgi:hypothetical protein